MTAKEIVDHFFRRGCAQRCCELRINVAFHCLKRLPIPGIRNAGRIALYPFDDVFILAAHPKAHALFDVHRVFTLRNTSHDKNVASAIAGDWSHRVGSIIAAVTMRVPTNGRRGCCATVKRRNRIPTSAIRVQIGNVVAVQQRCTIGSHLAKAAVIGT